MKIDPHAYGREFEYWLKAFDHFVDRASVGSLKDAHERLQSGIQRRAEFRWATSRPIKLQIATEYDRARGDARPVQVRWSFKACFSPDPTARGRRPLWDVLALNTEVDVREPDHDTLILRFHHDLKAKDQLGPHAHLQVSEDFLEEVVGVRLAVPRFPAVALLPTDCLDMILAEFFPHEWPKAQGEAVSLGSLRSGQMCRATSFAEALTQDWRNNPKRTPVTLLQNCHFPKLRLA